MMIITMRVDFDASWRAGYATCMMMTMKPMPKGWDTEWHARKSCPTWTSTMGHCSDLGHCVLCVCKNLAWQAKDRSSQHHNQITISFKSYAPFNFRMFHFGSVSSLSNSLAKKITCFWILPGTSTETFKFVCQLKMDQQHTLWSCWCFSCVALNYFFWLMIGSQKIAP